MKCPACGHENDDWDVVCSNCGQALPSQSEVPAVPIPIMPPEMPAAAQVPYAPVPVPPPAPPAYGAGSQFAPPAPPATPYGQYAPPGPHTGYAPPMPEPYLWQSIVVTLLCCWPLGIPAIIAATKVGSKYAQGDYAGAQAASQEARKWTFIALGLGITVVVLYVLLVVVLGLFSVGNLTYT